MESSYKEIQKQYQGYLNTNLLWKEKAVDGIQQFNPNFLSKDSLNEQITVNNRLGKRIEDFVFYQFEQSKGVSILVKNEQIQKGKRTIGELDCIFKHQEQLVHLEIVYKFYLYDNSVGVSEIDYWIAPNRNNSLASKLEKLNTQQFPLLYKAETKITLGKHQVFLENIKQEILFKAQLFAPYDDDESVTFNLINENCVDGFFINYKNLYLLNNASFFIPTKMNWLLKPEKSVVWTDFENFTANVHKFIKIQRSPLCWLQDSNGILKKFFVVWW